MKKKSHKPTSSSDPSTTTTNLPATDDGLKSLIHDNALFFDRLVELIPARFYLPVDDKEKPWFQGLSKAAKASAKKESRENLKKARRERLDPEKSATTLDLLKKSIEAGKATVTVGSPDQTEGEKATDGAVNHVVVADNAAMTYEELRNRLHRRIEELRATRNTRDPSKSKRERDDRSKGKRKREVEVNEELKKQKVSKKEKERDASAVDLSFGHVKLGEMGEKGRNRKGLSKVKELEKAEKLKEAMKDPQKGEIVSKKHSWKAAVSRAAGAKVHDDPKLIKESMKKEKKRRQKNAEKWKERVETTQKLKADKQKKRADNISEKIHQKKVKKIEKREKKLMRPGFEGRRESYINNS